MINIQALMEQEGFHWDGEVLERPEERGEWLKQEAGKIAETLKPNQRVVIEVITENETHQELSHISDMGSVMDDGRTFITTKQTSSAEYVQLFEKYVSHLPTGMDEDSKRELIYDAYNNIARGNSNESE